MKVVNKFSKNSDISNFKKTPLEGAELFLADGRTDRHDAFLNFADATKNQFIYLLLTLFLYPS